MSTRGGWDGEGEDDIGLGGGGMSDTEFDFLSCGPRTPVEDQKKKKSQYGKHAHSYSQQLKSLFEEQQQTGRFKEKRRRKSASSMVDATSSRGVHPDDRYKNSFDGIRTSGGSIKPNHKARRGKKDKDQSYESLNYSPQTTSRMEIREEVEGLSDAEDPKRRSTKPKKKKKRSPDALDIRKVNGNRNGYKRASTANDALNYADSQSPPQKRKKSGQRMDREGRPMADLDNGWIPKSKDLPPFQIKKSGQRVRNGQTQGPKKREYNSDSILAKLLGGNGSPSPTRQQPKRNKSKNRKKWGNDTSAEQPICLLSSSDEEAEFDDFDEDTQQAKRLSLQKPSYSNIPSPGNPTTYSIDVVKIAVGEKFVSRKENRLSFRLGPRPKMILSFTKPHKKGKKGKFKEGEKTYVELRLSLEDGECPIEGFNFFLNEAEDSDEVPQFLAFRIAPSEMNGLSQFPNYVLPKGAYEGLDGSNQIKKGLIVVEIRTPLQAKTDLSEVVSKVQTLQAFTGTRMEEELPREIAKEYAQTIMADNAREEQEMEEKKMRVRTRGSSKRGGTKADDELLLVWPFEIEEENREEIAKDAGPQVQWAGRVEEEESEDNEQESLVEDSDGDDSGEARNVTDTSANNANNNTNTSVDSTDSVGVDFTLGGHAGKSIQEEEPAGTTKAQAPSPPPEVGSGKRSSKDKVTITSGDIERLTPGEFLNDNLIDFWTKWITREGKHLGKYKFFTSHFYSTLRDEGVEGVKRWTKNPEQLLRNDFIFCPINESLHWSLAIICNPGFLLDQNGKLNAPEVKDFEGLIGNYTNAEDDDLRETLKQDIMEEKATTIIVLDSLKAHNKNRIGNNLRNWLKAVVQTADPKAKESKLDYVFKRKSELFKPQTPKVPYQLNSWDCGVFVCQYANAFVKAISSGSLGLGFGVFRTQRCLLDLDEFDFDQRDIDPLRNEIKDLIQGLSVKYAEFSKERAIRERKEKSERNKRRKEEEEKEKMREEEEDEVDLV